MPELTSPCPTVPRLAGLFESKRMVDHPIDVLNDHSADLGETFYYYLGGVKKVMITSSPPILRHVLKENADNYQKSPIQMDKMRHFLGTAMLTTHGEEWRRRRRLVQQGFRHERLRGMTELMSAALDEALPAFEADAARGPVEVNAHMMRLTFSMVTRAMFSESFSEDEIRAYSDAITRIQAFLVRQIIEPYLNPWFALSGEQARHDALRDGTEAILMDHIRARRERGHAEGDLLQVMLDGPFGDDGGPMSDEELLGECSGILLGGHETSSTSLSWTLYLLARHPDRLDRVRAELDAVLGDRPLAFADAGQLSYTTWILEEALRLYPPFWMVDRVALEDDAADGVEIPRGTTVVAFIYGAHHSPSHWSEPESFRPERFDGRETALRRGFLHLPFGGGPRICIGAGFARLQMLMILSVILRRYDVKLVSDEPVATRPMIVLRPHNGVRLKFERRRLN